MRKILVTLSALALAACSTTDMPETNVADTDASQTAEAVAGEDPYLWLEDVEGEDALAWVRSQNARTLADLQADPRYARILENWRSFREASFRWFGTAELAYARAVFAQD